MRVLVVENFHTSPLGQVGEALDEAGAEVVRVAPWKGENLPAPEDFHALVVLGGEQSALDDDRHPYLPVLAALMKRFGDMDKPVLGICLGSQLLARAYGGENHLGIAHEFGWHRVRPTDEAADDPVMRVAPPEFSIFQWHSDTFTLPNGAIHLATNDTAGNQCFRIGRCSYGMQFHFEASREVVGLWNDVFSDAVERIDPQWIRTYERRAASDGAQADHVGLAIARAWVSLVAQTAEA